MLAFAARCVKRRASMPVSHVRVSGLRTLTMSHQPSTEEHGKRLEDLRAAMASEKLDLYVVRATDRFLNEYVPSDESTRIWLSGFQGSTGDGLVGAAAAWMFVDGRYDLQAKRELDENKWGVHKVELGTSIERAIALKIRELSLTKPLRVGIESDRFSIETSGKFEEWLSGADVTLVKQSESLVERVRGKVRESSGSVWSIDEAWVGRSCAEKVSLASEWLTREKCVALLVQRLDEIAYITNLRGNELPFQTTFRSMALVTHERVVLAMDPAKVSFEVRSARPTVQFATESELHAALVALGAGARVALDAAGCTVATRAWIEQAGATVVLAASPFTEMKARKTEAELRTMQAAFRKADGVVEAAQRWLVERVCAGDRVTETDFAAQVERMFMASGAVGLSFRVISACGANAAMAHHANDPDRVIRRGEMMLLDTGAYYVDGYATDLTRTFFVGADADTPTAEMKRWFTYTLKAAIAGMSARIPRGATGAQLDGITRAPLWAAGLEFGHGTGHGVGINVHEAPPRVGSTSAMRLEEGHVFSIEPGVYVAGRGGVRIENLCTVEPDAEYEGFLRVRPMTFSPMDTRLTDESLLTESEKAFLAEFARASRA